MRKCFVARLSTSESINTGRDAVVKGKLSSCAKVFLTGSMALKKRSSHSGCVSVAIVGKRQRVLDTKVKEKLDEMKKHKTYKSYLMQRVCIPQREGEAIGVIDGGENKHKNGKSMDIRSFSVRFIVSCEYGESQDHFESIS